MFALAAYLPSQHYQTTPAADLIAPDAHACLNGKPRGDYRNHKNQTHLIGTPKVLRSTMSLLIDKQENGKEQWHRDFLH